MKIYSKIIIDRLISFQSEIDALTYDKVDIRKHFYDFIQSNQISYCNAYILLEISETFSNTGVMMSEDFGQQIKTILRSSKSTESKIKYLSHHHRNLIITVWSLYELLVTIMCDTILDDESKQELLNHQLKEVIDILDKENKIGTEKIEKLKGKLTKKHLTHVPINRKYNALFKLLNDYPRDIKSDKEFLDFLGSLRNSMHTNFIYYGDKEKMYIFHGYEFWFEPKKAVGWHDPEPTSPKLYLELTKELVDITTAILCGLKNNDIIPYPDIESQNIN